MWLKKERQRERERERRERERREREDVLFDSHPQSSRCLVLQFVDEGVQNKRLIQLKVEAISIGRR